MTVHTTAGFDRDTALEPVGDGLWRAVVTPSWFVTSGPNGGWVAAVATRAMIERVGDPERAPRSLTLHYLDAPAPGPLEIACALERAGGNTTSVSLRLVQDGRTVALGLGACGAWRDNEPHWSTARPPEVPGVEESFPIPPELVGVPAYWRNYEMRSAVGVPGSGAESFAAGWMRPVAPRPRDPVLVAALADAWAPPALVRATEPILAPTVDLTIHWRTPARGGGGHPWTLGAFRTRVAAGGVCEEDGELWTEDGVLLAQSRQLAILRRGGG